MMLTSMQILYDYFPFGSGLGSFGTFASAEYYSPVYSAYGIDHLWGLSKDMPAFICDAFYPELAQFGVAGVILYFAFGSQSSGNQRKNNCLVGNCLFC